MAPRFRRTRACLGALLAAAVVAACTENPGPPPGPPAEAPTIEAMARSLGANVVEHLRRGYYGPVSADVSLVPEPYNVVVRWSGKGLGTDLADPRTTHPTPWDYHQRVPIALVGPGYVRPGVRLGQPVDVADIAPTVAELLGFPFHAAKGRPLDAALLPAPRRAAPPRVIVTVAYDGGGWNLLEQWPDAWPVERRLMEEGVVFTNATIGSAPALTSSIHATMGTGAYPETHGISEITGRLPDGSVGDVYFDDATDPRLLLVPTVGDLWDEANGNRPWVGMIGYESWHLGMMSRGTRQPGGDRDVAVLWAREPGIGEFFVNEEFYDLPDGLPGEDDLRERLRALDGTDGAVDGRWRSYDLEDPRVVPATPSFVGHQGAALLRMMEDGGVGRDDLTDLVSVELKPTDFGGHLWNMVAPEEEVVLRAQDDVLGLLLDWLEREVPGRYVLILTADHGQTPKPETTGGLRIHPDLLGRRIDDYFERPIVQQVTPSGVFLDHEAMAEAGITAEDVARFIGDYRYGDGLPADVDRSAISQEVLDRRVFAAALPGEYLATISKADARALGPGEYPEGDLTSPAPVPL